MALRTDIVILRYSQLSDLGDVWLEPALTHFKFDNSADKIRVILYIDMFLICYYVLAFVYNPWF